MSFWISLIGITGETDFSQGIWIQTAFFISFIFHYMKTVNKRYVVNTVKRWNPHEGILSQRSGRDCNHTLFLLSPSVSREWLFCRSPLSLVLSFIAKNLTGDFFKALVKCQKHPSAASQGNTHDILQRDEERDGRRA